MHNVIDTMKQLTWGVEVECVGLSREEAAEVVCSVVGGTVGVAYNYSGKTVTQPDGRVWNIVRDASLSGGEYSSAEVVTPVMRWEDMDAFQKVLRALRARGARVDSSCGQHVHVGLIGQSVRAVQNVLRTAYRFEEVIVKAGGVQEHRLGRYCRLTDAQKVEAISKAKTMDAMRTAWYGMPNVVPTRYDGTRYSGVNLNSFFLRGTVEFRWFEGTLHAGEARSNVTLALALVAYSVVGKRARIADRNGPKGSSWRIQADKGWMRYFLRSLCGLHGAEFDAVVEHQTKRLPAPPPSAVVPSTPAASPEVTAVA